MTNKLQAEQEQKAEQARQAAADKLGIEGVLRSESGLHHRTGQRQDHGGGILRLQLPVLPRLGSGAARNSTRSTRTTRALPSSNFPSRGTESVAAAHAAIAARKQPGKYVAFHFALMSEKGYVDDEHRARRGEEDGARHRQAHRRHEGPGHRFRRSTPAHKLADAAKIDGTPAFIINGKMREGALDDKLLAQDGEELVLGPILANQARAMRANSRRYRRLRELALLAHRLRRDEKIVRTDRRCRRLAQMRANLTGYDRVFICERQEYRSSVPRKRRKRGRVLFDTCSLCARPYHEFEHRHRRYKDIIRDARMRFIARAIMAPACH